MIKKLLEVYDLANGKLVNFDKTMVSFNKGVSTERQGVLASSLGVKTIDIHDRYLGIPTIVGRSNKVLMKRVHEKVWKRLQGGKR